MNIEELSSCFDSMTPTKEQKDRILAGVMNAKSQPVKVIKFYRYAAAAAAVIAVGVFAAVYSNTGTQNIAPQVNAPQVAVVNQNNEVEKNTETADISKEKAAEADNPVPVEQKNLSFSGQVTEEGSMEELSEAYPELAENNVEDVPSVAMYDGEDMSRAMPAPSVSEDVQPYGDETEVVEESSEEIAGKYDSEDAITGGGSGGGSTSSGGGGGGGSAYMSLETKSLSINDVMNHSVYSDLMPTIYANKFNFRTAEEQQNRLKVIFSNEQGNYMSVSIVKDGEYSFYEQIISPEEIKNINSYGYINFAVKCGEYYVIYNVEAYDTTEVYNMVISSLYFSN